MYTKYQLLVAENKKYQRLSSLDYFTVYYRAMHFSANARSWDRMSSVCLSVRDVGEL